MEGEELWPWSRATSTRRSLTLHITDIARRTHRSGHPHGTQQANYHRHSQALDNNIILGHRASAAVGLHLTVVDGGSTNAHPTSLTRYNPLTALPLSFTDGHRAVIYVHLHQCFALLHHNCWHLILAPMCSISLTIFTDRPARFHFPCGLRFCHTTSSTPSPSLSTSCGFFAYLFRLLYGSLEIPCTTTRAYMGQLQPVTDEFAHCSHSPFPHPPFHTL